MQLVGMSISTFIHLLSSADPFDDPKPVNRRMRTMSAPATMRLMRLKSARSGQARVASVPGALLFFF